MSNTTNSIHIGQKWKFSTVAYEILVMVLSVDKTLVTFEVIQKLSGTIGFAIGHQYPSTVNSVLSGNSYSPWEDDDKTNSGATCIKCLDYFPYASSNSHFQCWACRSGW